MIVQDKYEPLEPIRILNFKKMDCDTDQTFKRG